MSVSRKGSQWRVDGYDALGRRVRRRVTSAETAAALAATLHTMRYAHLAPQVAHNLARGAIERYWEEARCNTQEQLKGHEGARR